MEKENVSATTDSPLSSKKTANLEKELTKTSSTKVDLNTDADSSPNAKEKKEAKEKKKEEKNLRNRLRSDSIDIVELEQLNEQNLKNYRARSRRNKATILILILLLIAAIVTIGVMLGISRLSNNSFLYIHGDGSAVYIVDGMELNRFRTPTDIQGNRLLEMDLDLKIESSGNYNIKFTIEIYQNGTKIDNSIIYEYDHDLFYYGDDGYCYSITSISGHQTIDLCQGVLIDYRYENSLNIENFKMEVHAYLEKV